MNVLAATGRVAEGKRGQEDKLKKSLGLQEWNEHEFWNQTDCSLGHSSNILLESS